VTAGPGEPWPELEARLVARPEELAGLRRRVRGWMAAVEVPDDVAADLLVALSEAATNAVLHAYPEHAPGPVRVKAERLGDAVVLTIEDDGRWRARGERHDGRGLGIIDALATRSEIERRPDGTRVVIRRALLQPPPVRPPRV
jgi:anti-sigma regulatory factor (Ser/Thr protein kinase)